MKRKVLFSAVLAIVIIALCYISVSILQTKKDEIIKYDDYIVLYNKMNEELKLPNYKNLGGNEDVNLVYIDNQLSFKTRSYLTIDDKQSNLSTQQRIEYVDDNNKDLLSIDLIYLSKPLNNDLIYWNNTLNDNEENEFIRTKFNENIIAYKNILIKISLYAKGDNEVDDNMLTAISLEVVKFIQNNQNE